MTPLTPERVVELGHGARRLLADRAFAAAVDQYRAVLADRFFNSLPAEAEERERLYSQRACLDSVIANLEGLLQAAGQIVAAQDAEYDGNA